MKSKSLALLVLVSVSAIISCNKSQTSQETQTKDTTVTELKTVIENLSIEVRDLKQELEVLKSNIEDTNDPESCGVFDVGGIMFAKDGTVLSQPIESHSSWKESGRDRSEEYKIETVLDDKNRIKHIKKSSHQYRQGAGIDPTVNYTETVEAEYTYGDKTITEVKTTTSTYDDWRNTSSTTVTTIQYF